MGTLVVEVREGQWKGDETLRTERRNTKHRKENSVTSHSDGFASLLQRLSARECLNCKSKKRNPKWARHASIMPTSQPLLARCSYEIEWMMHVPFMYVSLCILTLHA